MTEKTEVLVDHPVRKEKSVLTDLEIESGFKVIGPYIDDESTPVKKHCFVRKGYIIQQAVDMSSKHDYMIFQLRMLIQKHLVSKGIKNANVHIFSEYRVNLKDSDANMERDEVYPDITVFKEPFLGDRGSSPPGKIPVLVIEILSQSTGLLDLTEKRNKYRDRGIPNYWVLKKADDPKEGLEGSYFFKLRGNRYIDVSAEIQESGVLKCEDVFGLELRATDIWFSEEENDAVVKWHKTEQKAERVEKEKERVEKEKERVEKEKERVEKEKERVEKEKERVEKEKEQERQRAEQEKHLRIELTKKWSRYVELLSKGSSLTENEKEELKKLRSELQPENPSNS